MPDPHVLYIVTAVVVLGLVAWVVVVLSRPAEQALEGPVESKPARIPSAPPPAKQPSQPPPAKKESDRSARLDSHAEIKDSSVSSVSVSVTGEVPVDIEEEEEPTGPNALILVTAVGRTDPGLKRKHNEDAYVILEDHHMCVDAITEAFKTGDFGPPREPPLPKRASRIRGAILLGNDRILAAAQENDAYHGMGTTVVAAYFSPNNQRVYIANVGDSRCYRLREGKLHQITTDHTLGNAGIQGKSASVLSRAVGIEENVEVDASMESPLPGDIYLLCSDGLSRMVKDDEIQQTLSTVKDLEEATKILIDKANQGGGRDNITTILVRVQDAKGASAGTMPTRTATAPS
jgi:serine/threonine protein phosphatase PrpC